MAQYKGKSATITIEGKWSADIDPETIEVTVSADEAKAAIESGDLQVTNFGAADDSTVFVVTPAFLAQLKAKYERQGS